MNEIDAAAVFKPLLEGYRNTLNLAFRSHPQGTEIVEQLIAGDLTLDQIDAVFAEAEAYAVEAFMEKFPRGDKTDTP